MAPFTQDARGYTLVEILIVVGIAGLLAAIAVPSLGGAMKRYALTNSAQAVSSAIRGARYAAVTKNRSMRIRFNCPAADQMRVVEVTGNAGIDNAADRCDEDAYPYPDPDPNAGPSIDGPLVILSDDSDFEAVQDLEVDATGRITPLVGCPACVAAAPPGTVNIGNGDETLTLSVSANGQVHLD